MKFEEIRIPIAFKQSKPNESKISLERTYYEKYGTISKPMLITTTGFVIDGYIKYIILKEKGFSGELDPSLYKIGEDLAGVVSAKEDFEASLNNVTYSAAALTKNIRKIIYDNDGGYCYLCGDKINIDDMAIDHVVPKSGGGENSMHNARCCCFTCNQMKGNMSFEEFVEKIKKIHAFRNL